MGLVFWRWRWRRRKVSTRFRRAEGSDLDSMGEMRAIISALGGWGEDGRTRGGLASGSSSGERSSDRWQSSVTESWYERLGNGIVVRKNSTDDELSNKRATYFFRRLSSSSLIHESKSIQRWLPSSVVNEEFNAIDPHEVRQ